MSRSRMLPLAVGVVMAVAACGGGATGSGDVDDTAAVEAEGGDITTTMAEPTTSAATDTTTADTEAAEPAQDASSIDWATVDLTTIDWATIDMSQVDMEAIGDNPTVPDLDDETLTLISSRMDPGNATLTIGDQTWEFESFGCAFGHDATQSDVYAFSSNSFGEHEGTRVQMQANIRDASGEGRFEGPDLTHEVYIDDIDDFENPAISWDMSAPEGITIDGDILTAQGVFDDGLTTDVEEVPGTLEATCGTQSRR